MPRSHPCGGIQIVRRLVHGNRGLGIPGRDEVQLAGVRHEVTGGVDAGHGRLHQLRDDDPVLVELEPPGLDRSQVGLEPEEAKQGVDLEAIVLIGTIVVDRDRLDMTVTVDLTDLIKRPEIDLAFGVSAWSCCTDASCALNPSCR